MPFNPVRTSFSLLELFLEMNREIGQNFCCLTPKLTGTRLVRVRVQRMVRAFQANIVDAYGDEQLLKLELYLTRFDKVPRKGIVSFEHAASQVSFQSGTVGATQLHAPISFQTPPDKMHQARVVLTRNRQ